MKQIKALIDPKGLMNPGKRYAVVLIYGHRAAKPSFDIGYWSLVILRTVFFILRAGQGIFHRFSQTVDHVRFLQIFSGA